MAVLGFIGRRDEVAEREAALKQQLLTAASRKRNLLDVFADLGKSTPDSVREEILQVEKDEKVYQASLAKLDDEKALLDQQAETAKAFMATWAHVGDILAATSDEERAEILPLFVEAIVLMSAPAGRDFGTYSMRLQPELQGSATIGEKWEFSRDKAPDWSLPNRGSPLTGRALVCLSDQRAPQSTHDTNQGFIDVGAWRLTTYRKSAKVQFQASEADFTSKSTDSSPPSFIISKRDPMGLARFYQSLLDSGIVESRADLARHLGVSRARVTQVLRRLKPGGVNE